MGGQTLWVEDLCDCIADSSTTIGDLRFKDTESRVVSFGSDGCLLNGTTVNLQARINFLY